MAHITEHDVNKLLQRINNELRGYVGKYDIPMDLVMYWILDDIRVILANEIIGINYKVEL